MDAEIEAYRRDGAVAPLGVFAPGWIDALARGVERNMEEPGRGASAVRCRDRRN
ncbi:MAG: hypothetical protein L6R19_02980 [Alphaproteobacteria bacterium]|nr:hypothetical protein [Alphaproteobacteria bacterium]